MALSAFKWGKGDYFKYIGLCGLSLAAMVVIYAAAEYAAVTGISPVFPMDVLARAGAYAAMPGLWYLLGRSLYRLMSVRWSGGKRAGHLVIAVSPLAFHLLSLRAGGAARNALEGARDFLVAGQSFVFLYILVRYRSRLTDRDVKRLVDASLVLMAVFAPLFVLENLIGPIRAFYAAAGLAWPSILLLIFLIVLAAFRFTVAFMMKPHEEGGREKEPAFLRERGLTDRETEVALLLLDRRSYREIGERLFISIPTVKSHVHRAFQKLDVGTRGELLELAEGLKK
jgi:DNA-binding CsgD family transcriptional regulator